MSDATTRRVGRIRISPELLREALGLPLAHWIVAVRECPAEAVIEVIVSGPDMPLVQLGDIAPVVDVVYRRPDWALVSVNGRPVAPSDQEP